MGTQLDANQVLQASFDDASQSIKTTAIATISGDVIVDIDAASGDNVAIASADGTKKVDVETVSGKNVLDTQVLASALPIGASTEAKQDTGNASLASIDTHLIKSDTDNVTVVSSALPTGAATEAKQDVGNASLSSIDSKLTNPFPVSGPLTDTELRTTPVPISGTVTANIGTTNGLALDTSLSTIDSDIKASQPRKLQDGSGNNITSQVNGTQQALDIGINVAGTQIDPRTIRALTSSDTITAVQPTGTNLHSVVDSGTITTITNVVHVDDNGGSLTVDGPLTDTQLRASPVPISGTVTSNQGTNPWVVSGNKSDNSVVPGTNNIGVLPAVVRALRATLNQDNQTSLSVDVNGFLRTSNRSENIIGDLMVDHRVNQVEVNFSVAFDANLITNTVTNSGTATQGSGVAVYSTSTNANGTAKGVSVQTVNYRAGSEVYSFFTAAFTTPTAASSFQRIGIFDDNNGFFIGYEGTTFGLTRRSGGTDTTTARTSWNADPLDGSANSAFTRQGVPEAIDLTKLNVFRIVFSWFGAAPIRFEVLSPDVKWIIFHTINYPNTATGPSIQNPNLPLSVFVSKTASDATNLRLTTSCWAGGSSMDAVRVTDTITDYTLAPLVRSVLTGHTTAGGGSYVNVKVAPSGALTVDATGSTGIGVSTKTALTPSSPTAASVGIASAQALAANANRKGLILTNTSINIISFGLGAAAVLNSGITLYPGGSWSMDEYSFTTAAVNAIAGAAASNLAIQEFTT